MSRICIVSTLPVALTILAEGVPLTSKDIEFSDVSAMQLVAARTKAKASEYLIFHEYTARVKLIDKDGNRHEIPHDVLTNMSSVNFKKLEELEFELQLKLNADSLESQSS